MLSVSDKSVPINELAHTDQQQTKITHSRGLPEVPTMDHELTRELANWQRIELSSV